MNQKRFRGFTLIELLVVIAIIGILSAVVLASLNTARSKGNDAAVQSDLSTIQTEAEIYYGGAGNNTYGSAVALATCPTSGASMFVADTSIKSALAGATTAGGGPIQCIVTGGTSYVVQSPLSTGGYWCVDSSGVAKKEAAVLSGSPTACL